MSALSLAETRFLIDTRNIVEKRERERAAACLSERIFSNMTTPRKKINGYNSAIIKPNLLQIKCTISLFIHSPGLFKIITCVKIFDRL